MIGDFFVTGAGDREDRLVGYTAETALAHAETMVAETGESASVYEKREDGPGFGTYLATVSASDAGFSVVQIAGGLEVTVVPDEAAPEAQVVRLGCRACGADLGSHHRKGCSFITEAPWGRVQASQAVAR